MPVHAFNIADSVNPIGIAYSNENKAFIIDGPGCAEIATVSLRAHSGGKLLVREVETRVEDYCGWRTHMPANATFMLIKVTRDDGRIQLFAFNKTVTAGRDAASSLVSAHQISPGALMCASSDYDCSEGHFLYVGEES